MKKGIAIILSSYCPALATLSAASHLIMSPILAELDSLATHDSFPSNLPSVLDSQSGEHASSSLRDDSQWQRHRSEIDLLLQENPVRALQIISRLVDTLDLYAPALKGLQNVHKYTVDTLETVVFANGPARQAAAFLLGHTLAMYPLTAEAISLTVENILLGGASDLAMCTILGVKRASSILFEAQLPTLLRQIQMTAFHGTYVIAQDALKQAMKLYRPGEPGKSQWILDTTHTIFAASLRLCRHRQGGLQWACFILCNTPMLLRNDLRKRYPETCDAGLILENLLAEPGPSAKDLCFALPILATWETSRFCADGSIDRIIRFKITLDLEHAFEGLGQLACVILEKFAPHLSGVADLAIMALCDADSKFWRISQRLLGRLLAALGPITLDTMVAYLHCPSSVLLKDVRLLDMIASLLPTLRKRIIQVLVEAIGDATARGGDAAVLAALTVFPLDDSYLAQRAQDFVLWSLDEAKEQSVILLALQLAIDAHIATPATMRALTYKAAQLLLADDPHVVHMALSALSNPILASTLDEKSCQMILLALHQSLEPSIQIVAAKLLTHLSTGHRAIVQPLAWAHIRQSLSLMTFLQQVDPTRAIVEACILSNLLPALPASVHAKYVGPVKHLILSGLESSHESHVLSLIFQGLANLAKFGTWEATQQTQLAIDLLEMAQEIPKDSQHAALNAIARLLATPHHGDHYEILLSVHTTFRKGAHLDSDSKALVSGIYGTLGTVERNPVISRDSKAAINRENAIYDAKRVLQSTVAGVRDKSGAARHINWLVSKALLSGKMSEEVLEAITGLELPTLLIREIHAALDRKARPQALVISLSSALHASPIWLQQNWPETADLMGRCIAEGEVLSVLRGMDVVLQACN